MTGKPSYEDLERRIKALEKEVADRTIAEEALSESERKHAILVENLRAGIVTIVDRKLTYANRSFCRFLGYDCDELIGEDIIAYIAPAYREMVLKRYLDRMEGKDVPSNYEVELLKKDGTTIWVELDAKRITVGETYHNLVIFRDTTQRRQAEEKLRKSEERFRMMFEQAAVGVALSDTQSGKYLKVNQKYADIVGYSVEELHEMSFYDISHPDDLHEDLENMNMLIAGNIESFTIDKRFFQKDGSVFWGRITVSPMWREGASPDSHIAILEDITERKRLENEISEKNTLLEAVIMQSPFPMAIVSAEGRILFGNSAAAELMQVGDEAYPGRKISEVQPLYTLYLPDGTELPRDEYPVIKALNQEKTVNQELIVERRDGTRRWYTVNAIPIYSNTGKHIAAFVVFPDITERKQAEETIRESEKRYRSIMEASPNPIVTYDMQGNALYINPAFTRVFGWTYEEVAGRRIDYVPESAWPETRAVLQKLKRGEGLDGFLTQRYDKDRNIIDIDMSFGVWRDKSGKPAGSVVILRDVTEQKRLQKQLRHAQKMESIGILAGGIAHDFNNILAAIIGYSELSIGQKDRSKLNRYLEKILQSGNRAKELVLQILAFSRATETRKSVITVSPIIQEVLKLLRATIPSTIQIYDHLNAKNDLIYGESTQIHQVLMNLCTNANHAMQQNPTGVLEVWLDNTTLSTETMVGLFQLPPGDYLKLTVIDNGHGISSESLEKIFDPYFTTKSKKEGTGMGLSIIHGIVKDHDGGIGVESQVGKGTRFELFFPVTAAKDLPKARVSPTRRTGSEHILLVDDEQNLIDAYQEILEGHGYTVTGMSNSEEALEVFRKTPERFDIVLADYAMPNLAGDALAGQMMQIRPDIPIIIFTGYSDKFSSGSAAEMGIKAFAHKPLSGDDFTKLVRDVLDEQKRSPMEGHPDQEPSR